MLQWNPSTDPEGDAIKYCVTVNEDVEPDDIPVFTGCDDEIFTSDTSYTLPIPLERWKTYWWAVWARDENGNWSAASEWWSFETTMPTTLATLNQLFDFSLFDSKDLMLDHSRESLYRIIQNCLNDPTYTLSEIINFEEIIFIGDDTNPWINRYRSLTNVPVYYLSDRGRSVITPWLDANWDNEIRNATSNQDNFNTVYRGYPEENEKFEVLSFVDEVIPFCATDNYRSYIFSYDTKDDPPYGSAATLPEWINYLKAITEEYGRPIDILTITAHGIPSKVVMSERFDLINNDATRVAMEKLRNENILSSCDPTILLFSCEVGKGQMGADFIQALANWSGATVYANSVLTGDYKVDGDKVMRDWDLDVVKIPAGFVPCQETLDSPVRGGDETTLMFPG